MMIAVPILVLWYVGHSVLSRFAGTCTMGDTDRFVAGAILGMPAAIVAVALLLSTRPRRGWRSAVALAIIPLALIVLYLWVPLALSAGIRGHHLCGPQFDEYRDAMSGWERLIPLAHAAIALALLAGGARYARRASIAHPGAAPAGGLRGPGSMP